LAHGEIAFLAEYHRGFCTVLQWIEHRGLPCLNAPAEIAVMFDKLASHERFLKHGVNRPEATRAPDSFPALLEYIEARRHGQIFLKPLHGSSASGVCALRWKPGRAQLIAPIRAAADGERTILANSLNVRTYVTWVDIEQILTPLLPQGMILEPWIPKLTLPDGAVDLRVLVIAGEPRHWVVRQSWHPMTNLHLGNRRADPQSFQNELGPEKLEAIFALATRAAACFPQSLVAGVDVIVDARHRAYVGEINAFGDLLPQLEHRGDTAYTAVARAAMAQIHLGSNPGASLSATSNGPCVPSIPIEQTSTP
jgi:glutathione synthase/RimK-type ligase-like ATP-grasp enzyme